MEPSSHPQAPAPHIAGASVGQKPQGPTKKKKPALKGSKQSLSNVRFIYLIFFFNFVIECIIFLQCP